MYISSECVLWYAIYNILKLETLKETIYYYWNNKTQNDF